MGTFASDTFTAANGTIINGRTADTGGTWSPPSWGATNGAIQNNRAYGGNALSAFELDDAPATANYSVFCELVFTGFGGINYVGPFGRMDGSGNGYGAYRDTNDIALFRYDTGTTTLLGSVSIPYANCLIELHMLGTTIEVYVIESASGDYVTSAGGTSSTRQACISVTDATHSGAGLPGMLLGNSLATTRVHVEEFYASEAELYEETVETTMSLTQDEIVKAYRRPLYFTGTRIARLPDGEFVNGLPPREFLTVTLTDTDDATYYYYGGIDENGDWQINRYLKSDVTSKNFANETSNGAYTTLAAAWTDRASLSYA